MKILVTYAIPQEKVEVSFFGHTVLYCQTGIGKVNATLSVYEAVTRHHPDLILNIGTAGSLKHEIGSIVVCGKFIDRDMEKCKEFGVAFKHDFTEELARIPLLSGWNIDKICNTGDSFVTEAYHDADAYDMEAFAIAALAKSKSIPLLSVKYITDKIGENSIKHWEDKLSDANAGLEKFIQDKKFEIIYPVG